MKKLTVSCMLRLFTAAALAANSCLSCAPCIAAEESPSAETAAAKQVDIAARAAASAPYILKEKPIDIEAIIQGLLSTRNEGTKLIPSHFGHPGYENVGFVYDASVTSLVLKAAGYQAEAEELLDYFTKRLDVPMATVMASADTNNVFGILKLIRREDLPDGGVKAVVNAIDTGSANDLGRGLLEFYTTPGPMAFLIFAMLQVNSEKYMKYAFMLGDAILSMQDASGGIRDGDRASDRVHTEPNMDCYAAFLMLHGVSGDRKWLAAADGAMKWFMKHAFDRRKMAIYQGIWQKKPSKVFATDVYSWTMAGPAGDKFSADELRKLTFRMLENSVTSITLDLPDLSRRTAMLVDFSNAGDSRVVNSRRGFHPMGTIEWTGGVILALQKNAVRLWNKGDRRTARLYKALASILLREAAGCFYRIDKRPGLMSFYATGQGIEVAPFGAIQNKSVNGWTTTYFYVKGPDDTVAVKGGAAISAWILLPYIGVNPFILHDDYKKKYDAIPLEASDVAEAGRKLGEIAAGRAYTEAIPEKIPDRRVQIVEPRVFNKEMWDRIRRAHEAKREDDAAAVRQYYKEAEFWANKVMQNPVWVKLARSDNEMKAKEFGGIIFYPWGATYPNNDDPIHYAIQRYPILNEVSTAAWGLATVSQELGRKDEAKKWIRRIIDEFPLHQIAVVDENNPALIKGYWNAIVSWEDRTVDPAADPAIYDTYAEVLAEKKLQSAKPPTVIFSPARRDERPGKKP